jgi:DNA repair ATPase RecN
MKVTKLIIKNIGMISSEVIQLNKPLILFYGEIRQGKSTILNAVRWVCGAKWPSDIIKHGEKEGSIQLEFAGGCVSRSWYRSARSKETIAREISFVKDGKPVTRPAQAIQSLLNPFLINQNYLTEMGEADRKKFFTELFAVDTTALDTEMAAANKKASELRAALTAYGDIDLTVYEAVDTSALKSQLNAIRADYDQAVESINAENAKITDANATVARGVAALQQAKNAILELEQKLADAKANAEKVAAWLSSHTKCELLPMPSRLDTSALEAQIENSTAQNVRAEQYVKNKVTASKRDQQQAELKALEDRQRAIKAEKTAKLTAITDESGVKGLKFTDDGDFTYGGTTASMLSTSEIMRLSSDLSSLYPDGFGLDLIDRGESLGASIFELVDRAKSDDLTILATVVGERPAKTPPEIGVFVVKNGKLTS